ncbi:MAG TPA: hypothetical protein VFF40_00125 [Acidimicrobiia bacterium]|nr:hypothetical protein [Acidimicrobiia bacterium]
MASSERPASDGFTSRRAGPPSGPSDVRSAPFGGATAGQALGPAHYTVSATANERYWRAAGVDHPLLQAGRLYPPIAANLTILLFQTVAPRPLLHARQQLRCHRLGQSGFELTVAGHVTERFTKRGRDYAVVEAGIDLADGDRLWTSTATFCEVTP